MKVQIWSHSETGRLSLAALLAVVMHLSLAALPVNWRPVLQQPTVLRVTLTAPPPAPTPPPPEPVAPIAAVTTTPVVVPSAEAVPSSKLEPPAPAIAIARPSTGLKTVKAPLPKHEPKRELPKPPPVVAQPKPLPPPKAKPLKPTAPPIITAKTPNKDQKPLAKPERQRLVLAKSVDSADKDVEHSTDRNPTRFDRRAFDDDLDLPLASTKPARSVAQPSSGESSGGSATVAPVAASRPAPIEVGLRPLPGNPQPRYPAEARQRGIEGKVVLRLTVSAAGSVEAASVARSSGNDLLDQEARLTVMRWRFQPLAGPKVAQIPISFRLQN